MNEELNNLGFVQYQPGINDNKLSRMREKPDLMEKLLDTDRLLEQLENELQGFVWDENKQKYIKKYNPAVTKDFINEIMPYLRSHFNKIFPLTNYSKDEINSYMREIVDSLVIAFSIEYKRYFYQNTGTKQWTNLRFALDRCEHCIACLYNRALGNKERLMYMQTISQNIIDQKVDQQTSQPKKGLLSSLPFGKSFGGNSGGN